MYGHERKNKLTGKEDNLFATLYILKRAMDDWGSRNIAHWGYENFNITYMPFFMNIGSEGISNNEIAEKMRVTKQAASRIVRELEASGLVRGEKSDSDGRSVKLYLTEEGEKLQGIAMNEAKSLRKDYVKAIGRERYEIAETVLKELIDFHEQKLK
ncbi:MarR family winged helix-turn-helix transcriptional regulator [Chitinophaga pinensis]|uniref:MarR family transcriptional regulator n=1 Tax=Chitinophaga pinensis TaxID=79329 RepID=A0A5C6LK56_9BACT|nr:MarR family transcriptional regulator [Chitinophaga pinensis]TWV92219.1 MarR family transcriptional regulator [Chitinophaga pinensis]